MKISNGMRCGMGVLLGVLFFADVGHGADTAREFQDGPGAPQMVVIGAGSFRMGVAAGEVEREHIRDDFRRTSVPQHLVTIRHSFAIAKFDVTRDEFAQFVAETHRPDPDNCLTLDSSGNWNATRGANWHSPGFSQSGRDPVVCVNWDDAQAYLAWLNAKTGHVYRLPTEAEWEFAARAGTVTARYWGESAGNQCLYANGNDQTGKKPIQRWEGAQCSDGYAYTSPVGSFRPNAYGLYDMQGNVEQWIQDCWHTNYDGAPTDGSAWQPGGCNVRVRRGSSWYSDPPFLRSAARAAFDASSRMSQLGFRVVREVHETVHGE
jgi:formylglycine-generating enzyme required for sulfatase activity